MSNELARIGWAPMIEMYKQGEKMFKTLANAEGSVPEAYLDKPAAIFACIAMGAEMGIGPMQSLRSIYVVDGKPSMSADLMLAIAIERGIRHQWLETTGKVARLKLSREGFEPHEHSFSAEEAQQAGLMHKANWKKYPAAMLRARCLSAAMRAFCPDVMGAGVYVEGEIEEPEPAVRIVPEPTTDAAPMPEPDRVDDGEVMEEAPQPQRMSDCETEAQFRGWVERFGARVVLADKTGDVVAHGVERFGLTEGVVLGWLAQEEAA